MMKNATRSALVWRLAEGLAGILLLTACLLKTHQLSTQPVVSNWWFETRLSWTVMIMIEFALGTCLLTGTGRRLSVPSAGFLFLGFSGISTLKLMSGETSCGCFGQATIHPGWALSIDIAFLLGISGSLRSSRRISKEDAGDNAEGDVDIQGDRVEVDATQSTQSRPVGNRICAIALMLGLPVIFAMALLHSPTKLESDGKFVESGGYVVVDPGDWPGKRFPIKDHIVEVDADFETGNWTVILYNWDCGHCQELIETICNHEISSSTSNAEPTKRIALIEVPPLLAPPQEPRGNLKWGNLSTKRDWFVASPVVIEMVDGIVKKVYEQDDSDKWHTEYLRLIGQKTQ